MDDTQMSVPDADTLVEDTEGSEVDLDSLRRQIDPDNLIGTLLEECKEMTDDPIELCTDPRRIRQTVDSVRTFSYSYFTFDDVYGTQLQSWASKLLARYYDIERARREVNEWAKTHFKLFEKYGELTERYDEHSRKHLAIGSHEQVCDALKMSRTLAEIVQHLSKHRKNILCGWAEITLKTHFLKACSCTLTQEAQEAKDKANIELRAWDTKDQERTKAEEKIKFDSLGTVILAFATVFTSWAIVQDSQTTGSGATSGQ